MIRKTELKLALGNFIVCMGILFASISIFNLFSDNLKLLIAPLIQIFVNFYHLIFHKPIEATGLDLSENIKNIISIYLLLGGISSRAVSPNTSWIVSFLKKHEVVHNSRLREISLITKPFAKSIILTILFCLTLWPIVFYRIFKTPIYLETLGFAFKDENEELKPVYEIYPSNKEIPSGENGFDARNILLIQLTAMLLIIIFLFIFNNILA